jgi:Cys-tRNA(Pro)/Cys-tRNA(Cys) deacylase
MEFKNNVTRFLDSKRVSYQAFTYSYDAGIQSAVEVATAIGLPAEQVYKTLVTVADDAKRKPMLVVVPGQKKVKMAAHDQAESLTGLQTGGISPLALINKGFDVYLDDRALRFDAIAVSAGERGANLLVPVKDLIKLTRARMVRLAED